MARDIVVFKNVYYSYPREKSWALEDINFSIAEGEFLAVMGENGAGKTTFCRLFNGIIPHSSGGRLLGTVVVDGESTIEKSVPYLAGKVGMVLDDPDAQMFTSTARSEVAFGPENLLLPPPEIEQRVRMALSSVGLSGFEDRSTATLSGGEKQRLAIAAALALNGKILVLDEPLCRLDPDGAAEVMSVLKNIREKYQITVVMAAHESAMIAEFADRVCVLKKGRIAACDTAEKIFAESDLLDENGIQPAVFSGFYRRQGDDDAEISALFTEEGNILSERNAKTQAVSLTNFSFSYVKDSPSFENINLTIADNDFAAVIGRNGCGKTTLLKNITGLLRPRSGDIFIRGRNTRELSVSDISKEAGFVMQNPDTQLFTDSVYNEVAFALKNFGLSKTEIHRRVEDAVRTVGLKDMDAFPHALSRAERTLTVLACVLAMGCKIIIFDEVDVGQDYRGSLKIMNIARELHSKGYTIIFVTHNMPLVCEYAKRLIKMEKCGIIMDRKRKDSV